MRDITRNYISDLAMDMATQIQLQLDDFIKTRIKEITNITITSADDIIYLKKKYCILLYHFDTEHNLNDIRCSTVYTLEIDTPSFDGEKIHYMERMGNIYTFIKNEEGIWVYNHRC